MKHAPLTAREINMLTDVFGRHPEIHEVTLFGSRAKGTHAPSSDIDLSVRGARDELKAQRLASELDELPLPYRFDVLDFDLIDSEPLREHIARVGQIIYPVAKA